MTKPVNIRKCDQTTNKGFCFIISRHFSEPFLAMNTWGQVRGWVSWYLWILNIFISYNSCAKLLVCLVASVFLTFSCFTLYYRFFCLLTSDYIQQIADIDGWEETKSGFYSLSPFPAYSRFPSSDYVSILIPASGRKPVFHGSCFCLPSCRQPYLLALLTPFPLIVPFCPRNTWCLPAVAAICHASRHSFWFSTLSLV